MACYMGLETPNIDHSFPGLLQEKLGSGAVATRVPATKWGCTISTTRTVPGLRVGFSGSTHGRLRR